jgi:hypothetical protein
MCQPDLRNLHTDLLMDREKELRHLLDSLPDDLFSKLVIIEQAYECITEELAGREEVHLQEWSSPPKLLELVWKPLTPIIRKT